MPQQVWPEDVPEVQFPRNPPLDSNIKDLELYSGLCTIELQRLDEQLELFTDLLYTQGTF